MEQQDPSAISLEEDDKKQKFEQNIASTLRGKQTGENSTENSENGDATRDTCFSCKKG